MNQFQSQSVQDWAADALRKEREASQKAFREMTQDRDAWRRRAMAAETKLEFAAPQEYASIKAQRLAGACYAGILSAQKGE